MCEQGVAACRGLGFHRERDFRFVFDEEDALLTADYGDVLAVGCERFRWGSRHGNEEIEGSAREAAAECVVADRAIWIDFRSESKP